MPDPFDTLRAPVLPVDPDPAFAARLRERLARALHDPSPARPEGGTMPDLELEPWPPTVEAGGTGATITPYLAVAGAAAAIDWYREAFGARLRGQPIVMADGHIGHAELDLAGAGLMLSEEHPEAGVAAPEPGLGAAVTLHLEVPDVDAVIDRAVSAGARLDRPPADYEYGRNGVVVDPFGHRWLVSGPPAAQRPADRAPGTAQPAVGGPRHGDPGYVSLWVPDVGRAAGFFAAVLGWRYAPASGPQGRRVEGQSLHHGLWGGQTPTTLFCCFAVDDVEAAVGRVRSAGGTAAEPQPEPYGLIAECVDDQGVRFAVYQPPGGAPSTGGASTGGPGGEAPAPNGVRHGDLAYLTMQVVDSAKARAFYGQVLGWRFAAGRVPDGWQVEDVAPMVGLSGGHHVATTWGLYRVDDVDEAVRAVREAGGTATEPERQPYGVTATCTDDQGTRFAVGQL